VSTPPAADASVRPARATDAPAVAALTLGHWRTSYPALVPDDLDHAAATRQWREALADPGPNRLLVACSGDTVVGYIAVEPAGDGPGGEVTDLVVDADQQRGGHGSRLLAAAVADLQSQGITSVLTWVAEADEARARFLESAGFAADGSVRVLDLDGTGTTTVRQQRWSALLA
jgi:ribosomal protein S18 acetylase RimI-like enzyme